MESHQKLSSRFLGVETLYGERQGEYRIIGRLLATLAFNYPKTGPLFYKELKEYLYYAEKE